MLQSWPTKAVQVWFHTYSSSWPHASRFFRRTSFVHDPNTWQNEITQENREAEGKSPPTRSGQACSPRGNHRETRSVDCSSSVQQMIRVDFSWMISHNNVYIHSDGYAHVQKRLSNRKLTPPETNLQADGMWSCRKVCTIRHITNKELAHINDSTDAFRKVKNNHKQLLP